MWNKKPKVYSKIGLLTEKWAEEEKKRKSKFCARPFYPSVTNAANINIPLVLMQQETISETWKRFLKKQKILKRASLMLRIAAGIELQNLSMWTFEWECWFLLLSQSDFWEAKKGRKQMKSVKAPSSNKFHLFSLDCCLLVWKQEQFNCSLTDFTDCSDSNQ